MAQTSQQQRARNVSITIEYRCARCWGALVEKYVNGEWVVVCAADIEHEGRVTSTFVESRRKLNALEASEALANCGALLGIERPNLARAGHMLYGDDSL